VNLDETPEIIEFFESIILMLWDWALAEKWDKI